MYEDDPLKLLQELAAKHVLVEIALSSNDLILGIKGSRHPLRTYLKYGVPAALVTDDAGVSLEDNFADAATKARLRADLEEAFRAFERTHDR